MIRSVRSRVTVAATVLAALLLVAMGVLVVVVLQEQLADTLDDSLRHRADAITALLERGEPSIPLDEDTAIRIAPAGGSERIVGNVRAEPDWPHGTAEVATVRSLDAGHVRLRVLTRAVITPTGPAVLQLATRLEDVNEPTRVVVRSFAAAIPAVVALLAALVWWLVGRTLRPVERIRAQMADITVRDLSQRVPEPGTGDDIDRLARTTNATLAKLEEAVARQQRLVADASHELRTPLARVRAALEIDQTDPHADLAATHRSVLDDTIALQYLVEDLLHLARLDANASDAPVQAVELDDLVAREIDTVTARKKVTVRAGPIEAAVVDGRPHELARALRNLLDNAERHAVHTVTVGLTANEGHARLTITDDGPGIAPEARERVFERFARLDEARSGNGTGLGLAITRDIVTSHHGTVRIEGDDETRFVVTLPLAAPPAAPPAGPAVSAGDHR